MENRKADTTSLMFVAGLAIGAGVTALLTPKRGEDIRRSIRQGAEHVKGTIRHTANDVTESAQDKVDKAKNTVHKGAEKIADKTD